MNELLANAGRRFYLKHPWQLCLAVTGIALGVAVYVGVDLANNSARRAFELSADLITGRTTHHLMAIKGNISNSQYRELRIQHGPLQAAPVIEEVVRLARLPARSLTLIGVDPLEENGFRGFSGFIPGRGSDLTQLIIEPNSVLIPEALAQELNLDMGSSLRLLVNGTEKIVQIVGTILESSLSTEGGTAPIISDIATAQELLGTASISRVDLILNESEVARLESIDLEGITLVPASGRNAAFDELSRAFRINLTALSLLALMVGVFLIYATMSFAIVQRRATFGVLRAIGVNRTQLLLSILIEALAIGGLATVIGLFIGHQFANGLVELVLQTVDNLYFRSSVSAVPPSMLIYWKGLALGLGATILAAAAPALDAANTAPYTAMSRAALERSAQTLTRRAAWIAVPTSLAAIVLLTLSTRSLVVAFGGLFFIITAGALLVPSGTKLLAKLVEPATTFCFGIPGALAARGVSAHLSRTGVATAALSVAVATVVGIGLMIGSFRISVEEWLTGTLTADVYLSTESEDAFDYETLEALRTITGVLGTNETRFVRLPAGDGAISLRAHRPGPQGWGLTLTQQAPGDAISDMEDGKGVFISEPLAFRRGLSPGNELTLPTIGGDQQFSVLGIFRDYSTNGGTVLLPLSLYREHWQDNMISGVGVYLRDDANRAATFAAIQTVLANTNDIRVRSNDFIRERSLAIFDQTFRITEVLRILAGLVAFLGLASALMSIELERAKEIAILRALGLRPRQMRVLIMAQTGILGLAAGVFAIPLGIIMAALLIFVINVRSFGWSMDLVVTPNPLLTGIALALGAAILAGVYPATRATRFGLATQLREE